MLQSSGESDILEASMSEDESTAEQETSISIKDDHSNPTKRPEDDKNDDDTAKLLRRRDELQSRRRDLEKRKLRMQVRFSTLIINIFKYFLITTYVFCDVILMKYVLSDACKVHSNP